MNVDERESDSSAQGASVDGGNLDQGRRYWKAAISHLAPEKREAAWEFYLDRLESSAAADTLGGVMLLLEAHLAFFDDLPAALGAVAQRFESALKSVPNAAISTVNASSEGSGPSRKGGRFSIYVVALAAIVSSVLSVAGVFVYQRAPLGKQLERPADRTNVPPAYVPGVAVQPWSDPASHRTMGCVVVLRRAAWTETTRAGEAKVFVYSPAEEVRQTLRSLEQKSH